MTGDLLSKAREIVREKRGWINDHDALIAVAQALLAADDLIQAAAEYERYPNHVNLQHMFVMRGKYLQLLEPKL